MAICNYHQRGIMAFQLWNTLGGRLAIFQTVVAKLKAIDVSHNIDDGYFSLNAMPFRQCLFRVSLKRHYVKITVGNSWISQRDSCWDYFWFIAKYFATNNLKSKQTTRRSIQRLFLTEKYPANIFKAKTPSQQIWNTTSFSHVIEVTYYTE